MLRTQISSLGILFALLLSACSPEGAAPAGPQATRQPSSTPGSSPTSAPTTAAATRTQPEEVAVDRRTFRILPEASRASYQVQEKFFDRPLPNQAVGTTQEVEGEIQINLGDQPGGISTRVAVELDTIRSDASPRDGAMNEWLATDLYPTAVFTSTEAVNFPSNYIEGEEVSFQLAGDLSLRGLIRPAVFDVRGRLQGSTVTGSASTIVSMKAYGIPADSFFGLSIDDAVTIRLDFTAVDTRSGGEAAAESIPHFADPTPEAAASSGIDVPLHGEDLIAFISQRDGSDEIYLMNSDGTGSSRLTNSPAYEGAFRWLADGTRLSFVSSESMFEGKLELYLAGPPEWKPEKMTQQAFFEGNPVLSPDGSRLAYVLDGNIYVISTPEEGEDGGSGGVQLTKSPVFDGSPVWSPDGSRIAYVSGNERVNIYVIDVPEEPGGEIPDALDITGAPSFYGLPAWSPDGREIAFEGGEINADIYTAKSDGSETIRLTEASQYDGFPVWSPDGEKIVFRSYRDGNSEIYVMNADGSDPVNLSSHPASDESPTWSPDGKHIAFASDRDGKYQIYRMSADGTNVTRLTEDPVGAGGPVWQPQTK